jgi:DnaJ-class molecular chaperone
MRGSKTIKIPAGSQTGRKFRLTGEGMPVIDTSTYGNLFARIVVQVPDQLNDEQRAAFEQLRDLFNR